MPATKTNHHAPASQGDQTKIFMSHKKFNWGLAALACLMLASCSKSSSIDSEVEYLPVQLESDGKWGMVDGNGKMLFSDEFKNMPSLVVNGLFSVREGESYALYSAASKPALVPNCDDLISVGVCKDGVIPVTHPKSRINIINTKGNVLATLNPVGGKEIISCNSMVSEGLLMVETEEHLYGFVDKSGKVVIEPKFTAAHNFSEGKAIVSKNVNDEFVTVVIDKKGKELFRLKNDIQPIANGFRDGKLAARNNDGRCGFINEKGEFNKISSKVRMIADYDTKRIIFVSEDNQYGVMDTDGEIIVRAKYGHLCFLPDGNYLAKDDDEYLVIDKNGDKKFAIEDYSYVWPINNGTFAYVGKDGSHYALLDQDGKQIGKDDFADINISAFSVCGSAVNTDYFNSDAIVVALTDQLTAEGFGKYKIGMPASGLGITDYSDYVYSYNRTDTAMCKSGWRYQTNFAVTTDHCIAQREYDAFYNTNIVVNPESKVDCIKIRVSSEVPCWKEIKDAVYAGIQGKGYKLKDSSDDWAEFESKYCALYVNSSSNGTSISVSIKPNDSSPFFETVVCTDTVVAEAVFEEAVAVPIVAE